MVSPGPGHILICVGPDDVGDPPIPELLAYEQAIKPEVEARLDEAVKAGAQAFWICPLVSESELIDLKAAETRAAELRQTLGAAVGLVHGKMKPAERDRALRERGLRVSGTDLALGTGPSRGRGGRGGRGRRGAGPAGCRPRGRCRRRGPPPSLSRPGRSGP